MIRRFYVKTLLELSFGLMLIFVLVLGSIAFLDIKDLWNFTHVLYQHPLKVSKASRDIKSEILSIESSMKSIGLDKDLTKEGLDLELQKIDAHEKKIHHHFNTLDSCYLGPHEDVDSALSAFRSWRPLREEVIQSKRAGALNESYAKFKQNGIYRAALFARIDSIVSFSNKKADSLYLNAKNEVNVIVIHYAIVFGVLFLFSIVIVYLLVRYFTQPLKELTDITIQYGNGNYSIRSDYKSGNEIGILASAFNNMADSIEEELNVKDEISKIAALLLGENDIKPFCRKMLDVMMSVTKSKAGAFYLAEVDGSKLSLCEWGGAAANWKNSMDYTREGQLHKTFKEKKLLHLNISSENTVTFPVFTNDFQPKEIICVPFYENENITGTLILYTDTGFSSFAVKLTQEICFRLNANLNRVISFMKLRDFSVRIDEQYHLLENQSRELEIQSGNLINKNIELKFAKEKAELSDRLKTAFLLNMSHELRTPLNSIIGFSGILMKQLPGPLNEEQKKQIRMIKSSGCHLLSLINDILDISKIEAGEISPEIESFNIKDVIEEVIRMVWPFAESKHLPVYFVNTPEIGNISSDRKRVHQVILNLVNNAIKFTEKGSVNIHCYKENEFLKVEVADTGIGIKAEDINLLFNPFVQLENNLTRKFEGTGLGLSISKKLMEMLNGGIVVESEYGKGTRFILSFPV